MDRLLGLWIRICGPSEPFVELVDGCLDTSEGPGLVGAERPCRVLGLWFRWFLSPGAREALWQWDLRISGQLPAHDGDGVGDLGEQIVGDVPERWFPAECLVECRARAGTPEERQEV
ncbi:hypothetical protein [Corynebacterium antarcticum]|uniref:hypothetical protein n=1 Tax=Corynebacterium antarcticum TaxID=2800405 RepID=UPI002006C04E|nr:hypothetical protein [Corynebacterium antarcticum]MCK7661967.1 hypothetical protein [Corynebacterium antarcticum]